MRRAGFTLAEVVMALVVLQVGLLGVVGTLVLAATNMRRAAVLERAVTETERIYDSLVSEAQPGEGAWAAAGLRVRWSVAGDGAVHVEALGGGDSVVVSVLGRALPSATP